MAVLIQKNFTTSCPGELLDYINNDVTITTELLQIVTFNDGSPQTTDFWFNSTLSGTESTRLDEILFTEGSPKGWTCLPLSANMIDEQEFSDDYSASSNVIWSSEKISNTFIDQQPPTNRAGSPSRKVGDQLYWDGSKWITSHQQLVNITYGNIQPATGTSNIPNDNTVPLVTEGTLMGLATVTPEHAGHKFEIAFTCLVGSSSTNAIVTIAVFRNSTCIGTYPIVPTSGIFSIGEVNLSATFLDSPNTTETIQYTGRIGTSAGTWRLNTPGNGNTYGGTITSGSEFIIKEFRIFGG